MEKGWRNVLKRRFMLLKLHLRNRFTLHSNYKCEMCEKNAVVSVGFCGVNVSCLCDKHKNEVMSQYKRMGSPGQITIRPVKVKNQSWFSQLLCRIVTRYVRLSG